ncbi:hypothetical protein KTD31_01145 [Burkholderia multivorans]|jgi:hypothetical protein|uniref:hypothetical protein n=1 Tax=Burkholderia multivorans TaxID=87883 RepID=UPI001C21B105|nr:hypothetical protein [Burkholderia multivorans]MBU9200008.1 hypothetical protein [Burkholderia multivorans]MDN8078873.1 hypothetical protein [Burkholderia multivorans]
MFNLIFTVIGLALTIAVTTVTANYIPWTAQSRHMMQVEAAGGLHSLEGSVTRYLDAHRDSNGNIIYPGDGVNLAPAVAPTYGFIPADVRKQMTWSLTTGTMDGLPSVGICLRPIGAGTVDEQVVLANLKTQLPVGSAFIGTGCNAVADAAGGSTLTYWVPLAHVN